MPVLSTTITDTEMKALSFVALSPQDWVDNAVHERARLAIEQIVQICVQECLADGTPIPGSKEAMVDLAFARGWASAASGTSAPQGTV